MTFRSSNFLSFSSHSKSAGDHRISAGITKGGVFQIGPSIYPYFSSVISLASLTIKTLTDSFRHLNYCLLVIRKYTNNVQTRSSEFACTRVEHFTPSTRIRKISSLVSLLLFMTLLQLRIEFNHCFADSFSILDWLEVNTLDNHRCGIGQLNVLLAASLSRNTSMP